MFGRHRSENRAPSFGGEASLVGAKWSDFENPGTIKVRFRIEDIHGLKGRDRNACYSLIDADDLYILELQIVMNNVRGGAGFAFINT